MLCLEERGKNRVAVVRVGSRSRFFFYFLLGMMNKQVAKLDSRPVVQVLIIFSVATTEVKE